MEEKWKHVDGYIGLYKVSNLGNVFSVRMNRIMRPIKSHHGYKRIQLFDDKGNMRTFAIHRLVANAWVENPGGFPEINHKNMDTSDNRAENLEWCDRKYNINYGGRAEKLSQPVCMYTLDGKFIRSFKSQSAASKETGISQGSISNVISGRAKTAGGNIWKLM